MNRVDRFLFTQKRPRPKKMKHNNLHNFTHSSHMQSTAVLRVVLDHSCCNHCRKKTSVPQSDASPSRKWRPKVWVTRRSPRRLGNTHDCEHCQYLWKQAHDLKVAPMTLRCRKRASRTLQRVGTHSPFENTESGPEGRCVFNVLAASAEKLCKTRVIHPGNNL